MQPILNFWDWLEGSMGLGGKAVPCKARKGKKWELTWPIEDNQQIAKNRMKGLNLYWVYG